MIRRIEKGGSGSGPWPGPGPAPLAGLLLWLLVAALPLQASAHGVDLRAEKNQALVVRAEYDDGEPMSYAKVRIITPEGRTHQVGNADAWGRFAWLPGEDGRWRAVVEDGMGHRAELALFWQKGTEIKQSRPAGAIPPGRPSWERVIWGLVLIWFLGGAVFWIKGRKRGGKPG